MAQDLLHRRQADPHLQGRRGERVPQHMWTHVPGDPRAVGHRLDDARPSGRPDHGVEDTCPVANVGQQEAGIDQVEHRLELQVRRLRLLVAHVVQTGILGVAAGELQDRVILVDADDRALPPTRRAISTVTSPAPHPRSRQLIRSARPISSSNRPVERLKDPCQHLEASLPVATATDYVVLHPSRPIAHGPGSQNNVFSPWPSHKKELGIERSRREFTDSLPGAFRENPWFSSPEQVKIARSGTAFPDRLNFFELIAGHVWYDMDH